MTRVEANSYTVFPTGFDECDHPDRYDFTLVVINGHKWGWSVRFRDGDVRAMNRKGKMIWERRGSEQNKHRRYPPEEALELAEKYVDTLPRAGSMNFKQFMDWAKAKSA